MTQENMLIVTARILNEADELRTITTEAIPESQFESVVNSFEIKSRNTGQEVHGIAVRKCVDPSINQQEFAEYWNGLKFNREIPFGKKFNHLMQRYITVNTVLLETDRLRSVMKRYAFEYKQRTLESFRP